MGGQRGGHCGVAARFGVAPSRVTIERGPVPE